MRQSYSEISETRQREAGARGTLITPGKSMARADRRAPRLTIPPMISHWRPKGRLFLCP